MNTNDDKIVEGDLAFQVVGAAFAVHNALGCGLREKTYERALCVELDHLGIPHSSQRRYPVFYRDVKVDEFIPDLVVDDRIIIDTKTVDRLIDEHRGQMLNYLRITGLRLGLLLNFSHPELETQRLVL